MSSVRIIPATHVHLEAFVRDRQELSELLGSSIPEGWPEFPEAIPHTLEVLGGAPRRVGVVDVLLC